MSDIAKKVIWSIVLPIPSAAIGVIFHGVFQVWGIFDPFSQWLGGWLKMHITPVQVEWTIAAGVAILAYAVLLWIVWRYHRTSTPIIIGDQTNLHGEVVGHSETTTKEQQTGAHQRISLLELLSEAAAKGWVFDNRDPLHEFTHGLQQAASEGSVAIWGSDLETGRDPKSAPRINVSEKIVAAYFKEHWIDAHQGLWHNDNIYTRTSLPSGRHEPRFYSDLHVERKPALAWLNGAAEYIRKSYDARCQQTR
jgi:hypothetical protein